MQRRLEEYESERNMVQIMLTKAAITMQRYARGFITRLKLRKFQEMQDAYEKAKLADMLNEMSSSVNDYALMKATPAKDARPTMSPIKEIATGEKSEFVKTPPKSKKKETDEVTWDDVEKATIKI
jgi:hypothetical protein